MSETIELIILIESILFEAIDDEINIINRVIAEITIRSEAFIIIGRLVVK